MRIFGIDIGKISFKAVWLEKQNGLWEVRDTFWEVHQQEIEKIWQELQTKWQIKKDDEIVVATGRLHQDRIRKEILPFPHIPEKVAQEEAARFLYPAQDLTIIRLGGGGFSVLKIRESGPSEFRQNPRCAAGVGIFLDQIRDRLGVKNIQQANQLTKDVEALEITSRCGVTMKTDATHLANAGFPKEAIMAGLFDSSAKNTANLALRSEISSRVLIIGGLSEFERIVRTIQENLAQGVKIEVPQEALYFEALGAALIGKKIAEDKNFILPQSPVEIKPLIYLPGLSKFLSQVSRMESPEFKKPSLFVPLIAGFDIGSTGSKLVIFDPVAGNSIFEAYTETRGQPIEAARELFRRLSSRLRDQIKAVGCTGSGRYTVGGLIKCSLPPAARERVFIMVEIAAHAAGAHYWDPTVDSVGDIGGQDCKWTMMELGRVIDSCMNTVCSAGTGSFLAEQLQLLGINNVVELGKIALEAPRAIDLGQHCAVFISEQIDEARRKGATLPEIVAGLYYSIIRNYDNRVKGARQWGNRIFLQGKPAENTALACALAATTGRKIIVPPSPGTPGALGIAILTKKEMQKLAKDLTQEASLDLTSFLNIPILDIKEFQCQSKEGCLEGNQCWIQEFIVGGDGQKKTFFFGGHCDKWEKRPGKNLELAKGPRPFIERERLIQQLLNKEVGVSSKVVAIPRGLETEEILPMAIIFFQELKFKVKLQKPLGLKVLEEGSKLCSATYCAPLQLLAGQAKLQEDADFLFLPKVIEISGIVENPDKQRCFVCPLSQAMPDMFSPKLSTKVLQPFLDFKKGYWQNREEFLKMGSELGCSAEVSLAAFKKAVEAQEAFERECYKIGSEALNFAKLNKIPAIVVLGHPYIINSSLLLAGIPQAIEENGAIALPADCYPLDEDENSLPQNLYWGYGQRLLQAAYEIRRKPGVYPLWLSVYSCGPDSFLIHFFQYLAQGKPYTILESDAYTGQAGFKTRVEAFLYGVKNYQPPEREVLTDLKHFDTHESLTQIKESGWTVLIPWMGENSRSMAALFRSMGIKSQALLLGDQESLKLGRGCTSGKECLPMIITLGGLLKYLNEHLDESFYYFMPQASGPCRFGQYQLLFKIILEKLGLAERVKIVSPTSETGYQYQKETGPAFMAKAWVAVVFVDLLKDALHDIRPEEKDSGLAQEVFDDFLKIAELIIERPSIDSNWRNLWGFERLAERAARSFQQVPRGPEKQKKPTVLVTGEIYVRLDSFANNFVVRELENLGCKVKLAPTREWFNYVNHLRKHQETLLRASRLKTYLSWRLQRIIEHKLYKIFAQVLGWPEDHHVETILETARPYLSGLKPLGEAGLTIGLPLLLWQKKEIDGAVIVGPFECMPSRIAESQLNLISQQTGLPVLNLSFYGEPLDRDVLETFVWDLKK